MSQFTPLFDCSDDNPTPAAGPAVVKIPTHPWAAAIDDPAPVAQKTAQQLLMGDDVVNTPEYIAANNPGATAQPGRFWDSFLL